MGSPAFLLATQLARNTIAATGRCPACRSSASAGIAFIDAMNDGDQVAILKFNVTSGASIVQEFVAIDHGVNSAALEAVVMEEYAGDGTNIYDALQLGIEYLVSPPNPLPPD